jgi:ketosteroid isomerase-like protein
VRTLRFAVLCVLLLAFTVVASAAPSGTMFHERKEAAGHSHFNTNDRGDLEIPGRDGGGAGPQGDDVDGVAAALAAYSAAIGAMDVDAAGALVTDDFLIFEGAGVNRGWADYRDNHLGPELEMFEAISFEFSEIEAEASGNLAWASFRYATHIEMPERVSDSGGVSATP